MEGASNGGGNERKEIVKDWHRMRLLLANPSFNFRCGDQMLKILVPLNCQDGLHGYR